jgi:hypothetical protein
LVEEAAEFASSDETGVHTTITIKNPREIDLQ